jgi:predicted amidohydrolase YtcJ
MPDAFPRDEITRVIVNARIQTGDARRPWADAVAMAVDRVVVVGSSAEIRKLAPPTAQVVDAAGATLRISAGGVIDFSG